MPHALPLYHASLSGMTGALAVIGAHRLFFPCETQEVHVVHAQAPLIVAGRISEEMTAYIRLDIELRLQHHTARGAFHASTTA